MKKVILCSAALMLLSLLTVAQNKPKALPHNTYKTMVQSITSADITLLLGGGGTLSIDKNNVGILKDFIEASSTEKIDVPQAASIYCQINGVEFLQGRIYLGETSGAVVFNVDNKEYVNELNQKATQFFWSIMLNQ